MKTIVLYRPKVLTVRTKLVFTSRRISYICLGTDNLRLAVEEGALLG